MDSPYRSADLDVLQTKSRSDRRCGTFALCTRGQVPLRKPGWRASEVVGAIMAVVFTVGSLVTIGVGVQACVMLSSFNPRPVLLHVERPAPVQTAARVSTPPAPAPLLRLDQPVLPATLLALTEPVTHDPVVLRARAHEMEKSGLPVRALDVRLPAWEVPRVEPFQVNALPFRGASQRVEGIELRYVPKFSLLARAGFVEGDEIVSIDNYPAAGTEWTDHVFVNADRGGSAVVELFRDRQRLVVSISWPAAPAPRVGRSPT